MTAGVLALASSKRLLTSSSLSPCHLLTRSDEETEKNVECASVATALARYDFPEPIGCMCVCVCVCVCACVNSIYVWREGNKIILNSHYTLGLKCNCHRKIFLVYNCCRIIRIWCKINYKYQSFTKSYQCNSCILAKQCSML